MRRPRVDGAELRREVKRQRIERSSAKYNKHTDDIPEALKVHFDAIVDVGDTKWFDYEDSTAEPWTAENKQRALRTTELAVKCRKELQNESGWRAQIESKLFERFDDEVTCKSCGGRFWRSSREVDPLSSNSVTTSLADRQRDRLSCGCDPSKRISSLDSGLNNLFMSRRDTACHAADGSASTPKKKPDLILGLNRTSKFDTYLQARYAHQDRGHPKTVDEIVKTSLQSDNGGSQLLFPFLVVEAKSEQSASSFEKAETQSCLPIKHALDLQLNLLRTRGNTRDVPGGPLVWFLSYLGENWRVHAGYVKRDHNLLEEEYMTEYVIKHLWSGSVTGSTESLQLVLIIDYIIDWARDTFRFNILRQLQSLATRNNDDRATVDEDVVSRSGLFQDRRGTLPAVIENWQEQVNDEAESEDLGPTPEQPSNEAVDAPEDPYDRFKTSHGVVKDARRIESRLKGLLITRDNLETILQSFDTDTQMDRFARQQFARGVITLLGDRCVAFEGGSVLETLEKAWTGNEPTRPPLRSFGTTTIYIQFQVSFYISPSWDIVRELTYLAVCKDAVNLLIEHAAYQRKKPLAGFSPTTCREKKLLSALDGIRSRSVHDDLVSGLCRHTYFLELGNLVIVETVDADNVARQIQESLITFQQDTDEKSPGPRMKSEVHTIFENHRIGNRQPSEPFLRASSRIDSEGREPGERFGHDKVLVYSEVPNKKRLPNLASCRYCLYMTDGQQDLRESSVVKKLVGSLRDKEVSKTVRKWKSLGAKCEQDNQVEYRFSWSDPATERELGISEIKFQEQICR